METPKQKMKKVGERGRDGQASTRREKKSSFSGYVRVSTSFRKLRAHSSLSTFFFGLFVFFMNFDNTFSLLFLIREVTLTWRERKMEKRAGG